MVAFSRRLDLPLAALFAFFWLVAPAQAMGCPINRTPASKEACDAHLVVIGTFSNARLTPGTTDQGFTDLHIDRVLRGAAILDGERDLVVPRYVDTCKGKPVVYMLFGDFDKGVIDWYRGIPCDGAADAMADYFEGAFSSWHAPAGPRLAYFVRFLSDPHAPISEDANLVLQEASRAELRQAAPLCDHHALLNGLLDPRSPDWRRGRFAMLIGLYGNASDAGLLRGQIAATDPSVPVRAELWYALALLEPQPTVRLLYAELLDARSEFNQRYAALRALRWLLEDDAPVDRAGIFACLAEALPQADMADLLMEALREHRRWDKAALVLMPRRADDPKIVHRAQLRFALTCPGRLAGEFVTRVQTTTPDRVSEAIELLTLEQRSELKATLDSKWWLSWSKIFVE